MWLPVTVRTGMDKPSCVFEKKLDKLFFLMCVSINRFKKNKRTIITLLKSTR